MIHADPYNTIWKPTNGHEECALNNTNIYIYKIINECVNCKINAKLLRG